MAARQPIILASASPRRRELLERMGVHFEVVTAEVQEITEAGTIGPLTVALYNARFKALAVAKIRPERWVLAADTVVALKGKILGKPPSLDQARDYLRMLSGQTHEVVTGCALMNPNTNTFLDTETFFARSRVTFHLLSEETIERYLAEVNVLDKAGAYALQERGEWIVKRVEGSRTNVIGLPTETLERVFIRRGLL
jgi:septum formation protein